MAAGTAPSGIEALDGVLGGLYWGDNVVWETEPPASAEPFYRAVAEYAEAYARALYVSLDDPPAAVAGRYPRLEVVDARPSGDVATAGLLLAELRRRVRPGEGDLLLFDPLERMIDLWGAQTAARFFTRCCPQLLELGAVAYWCYSRADVPAAVRREVAEVTQCVIAVSESRVRIAKAEGRPPSVKGAVLRYRTEDGRPALESAPTVARLGAALCAAREERGLSQTQLAKLAGVSASAISQTERGRRGLSLETLLELTERLGITLDELLRGELVPEYRLARRDYPQPADGRAAALLDDPNVGLRAYLARVPPGASGAPAKAHKGVELLAVGRGLVQVQLERGRPVLREGEALLVEHSAVRGWRNLGETEALVFLVLRDDAGRGRASLEGG